MSIEALVKNTHITSKNSWCCIKHFIVHDVTTINDQNIYKIFCMERFDYNP